MQGWQVLAACRLGQFTVVDSVDYKEWKLRNIGLNI